MATTRATAEEPDQSLEPETVPEPEDLDRAKAPEKAGGRSAVRTLLRLWPYVRPVRARLSVAALVAIVASCVGLVIPLVLKWMVDGPVADRDPAGVWLGALYLLLLGLTEALLFGLRRWLVARPLAGVEASMRADLYRHLQRLPVSFHDRWASGQLLSRGTTDLMLLRMFLAFPLTFLLVNAVTIVVGVIIMLVQDWTLGLVILGPAIPVMVTCVIFERKYAEVARLAQDQVGDLTTVVEESVLGIRIVKGFGRHRSQARAFRELSRTLRGTELRKARLLSVIWGVIITLPELAIGAALVLGVVQVADGVLSAGTLVAFLSTALALRWPVDSIGFLLAMSQEAATATERYFEVMDEKPESSARSTPPASTDADIAVTAGATATVGAAAGGGTAAVASPTADGGAPATADATATVGAAAASTASASASGGSESGGRRSAPSNGRARSATSAAGSAGARDGGLRFHHVTFRYPDAGPGTTPTLDRVDLHIRPGESMALVGATGSGKTTLTALVPRLHEVTSGRITLDGEDITAMSREELRAKVAVAFEEPTLFSATVGENVLMGAHPDAGETELDRALAIAQAEFAHALPQGTATQVGEQGLSLSGGQRQRLALARAVVGRPRFLVLDDPLSALDVHTEAAVEAALRRVLAETTALIVAHRPSTVLLADRVALLSGGRITAVGTHQELLRTNAEYAHLMSGTEEDER
ncbi:ABC transporter ATP-binding protein [Streptomyces scabiei]|uniref:ABC transporter ATP-binding protein n=1 Tax=Streptomyces scabiei TaxID=1930 RepID=UPI001B343C10|nr:MULTISPECIES: ABC transporter ATP-binding protein [Streptomyces]MBP5890911.1 ABC transporter ATP-binding protein [Streptomyces sp. LBUM 1481]MBP5921053.1 ABC transporter ATP-binding protein [Streptomyces sp. LBUM 1483]MDX2686539.1 ABC transporter ATP-binding protein [Streptomyces scabiei]MDX2751931.1 ABC transporter ATP-binding protein [Streptomyces scabiei]MDX2807127.1 ABC transporter ATP-binding protein [Streptomyces scabiei]